MVLAHLEKILERARFQSELVDLDPVSVHAPVLLLLPLHKGHPIGPPQPVHPVALLLDVPRVQTQRGREAWNSEPDVAQPAFPVDADHEDQVIEGRSVKTRQPAPHLAGEHGHLEAQLPEQPREEAVDFVAEAASVLDHDLLVEDGQIQLDAAAAVDRQVLKGHRPQVTPVQRPEDVQGRLGGTGEADARQIFRDVHVHRRHLFHSLFPEQ